MDRAQLKDIIDLIFDTAEQHFINRPMIVMILNMVQAVVVGMLIDKILGAGKIKGIIAALVCVLLLSSDASACHRSPSGRVIGGRNVSVRAISPQQTTVFAPTPTAFPTVSPTVVPTVFATPANFAPVVSPAAFVTPVTYLPAAPTNCPNGKCPLR